MQLSRQCSAVGFTVGFRALLRFKSCQKARLAYRLKIDASIYLLAGDRRCFTPHTQCEVTAEDEVSGGVIWWNYNREFTERCLNIDSFALEDCVNDVYNISKVDSGLIAQCMEDSGGLESYGANEFLAVAVDAQKRAGVTTVPTLIVNGIISEASTIGVMGIFRAICEAYSSDLPEVCKQCSQSENLVTCVQNG